MGHPVYIRCFKNWRSFICANRVHVLSTRKSLHNLRDCSSVEYICICVLWCSKLYFYIEETRILCRGCIHVIAEHYLNFDEKCGRKGKNAPRREKSTSVTAAPPKFACPPPSSQKSPNGVARWGENTHLSSARRWPLVRGDVSGDLEGTAVCRSVGPAEVGGVSTVSQSVHLRYRYRAEPRTSAW